MYGIYETQDQIPFLYRNLQSPPEKVHTYHMIKFFRRIRQGLLSESKFSKYIFYALGEIFLVVIGILIALQINNWNENQRDQKTSIILANSITQDLNQDVAFLKDAIEFSHKKIEKIEQLQAILDTPIETWDKAQFYENINLIAQSNPFFPTDGTYEQILTTGSLKLFHQSVANKLNAYYTNIKQIHYWSEVEDKSLWLMAEILWKGINIRALGEMRFNQPLVNTQYLRIKPESIDEFSNYVAAVNTYRSKTLKEYEEQLELANAIIASLKQLEYY